ncbi:MAG: zinc ABC transporter substrate-binding protein, partial [Anaerolineales bacterium]|nr:zinc ABC transporter substrate-binding protein [Anaerolineales bacterium]
MNRIFIIAALLLTACGGQSASSAGLADSPVLASTTLLADIAQSAAGERLHIGSILPVGADPHSYQPAPQDVTKVAASKLLIVNGAGYERFLDPLLENAGGEREVATASAGLSSGLEPGDPHFWVDPNNVIVYVENIREALTHLDPAGAAEFKSNADAYVVELRELDAWIVEQVDQIPVEKRLLVTNHESLGYFAERYGFEVVGSVLESFSSDASPPAQQMAALIDQIKSTGAPAIFLDAGDN